jgi:hypothetical protein
MKTFIRSLIAACAAAPAWAHEGHGLPGASHWHATDTFGLLLVALLAGAAIAWSRRK